MSSSTVSKERLEYRHIAGCLSVLCKLYVLLDLSLCVVFLCVCV